jgi:hypothetical protein
MTAQRATILTDPASLFIIRGGSSMKRSTKFFALVTTLLLPAAVPVSAQVTVVFGTSWDSPALTLQNILDARYGAGNINVTIDYIGHDVGDPDPFYWTGIGFDTFLIREVAGHANTNIVGWYLETGAMPVIDGTDDGVVFTGPMGAGATSIMDFSNVNQPFGFYLNPNGTGDAINAPEPELFFSNRLFNDEGPSGAGALHLPSGGDVQALVFDVSAWTQPNTWVVAFEDLDSGANPAPCCSPTDNDFNDLVFEVKVMGPVPVEIVTFSRIKSMRR